MADIKLIAVDLDGTLLDRHSRISKENIDAINEARANGKIIVPVTGRAFSALPEGLLDIEGIDYLITGNGSVIYRKSDLEVLRRYTLTREQTMDMVDIIEDMESECEVYYGGIVYASRQELEHFDNAYGIPPLTKEYLFSTRTMVESIKELVHRSPEGAEMVGAIFGSLELRQEVIDYLGKYDLFITEGIKDNIEILNKHANKGEAFREFASMMGIKKSETAAFGDNFNDIELLESAGIRICMENGQDALKKKCDAITKSCDESGVAFGFREILGVC